MNRAARRAAARVKPATIEDRVLEYGLFDERIFYSTLFRTDPHRVYGVLRRRCPVFQEPGRSDFILTRHADVVRLLRDPRAIVMHHDAEATGLPATLLRSNPPEHTELRSLMARALVPQVPPLRPALAAIIGPIVAAARARCRTNPHSAIDLVEAISRPITGAAFQLLFGLPDAAAPRFQEQSEALLLAEALAMDEDKWATLDDLVNVSADLIAAAASPFITAFAATAQADGMAEDDIPYHIAELAIAAYHALRDTLSTTILTLAEHPAAYRQLVAGHVTAADAVEELLRFRSPNHGMGRRCAADIPIGGTVLPAGSTVWAVLAAADRDPAAFPDPDRLDLTRRPRTQIAFGGGPHRCIGAAFARLVLEVTLAALVQQVRAITIRRAPAWRRSSGLEQSAERIEVTLT